MDDTFILRNPEGILGGNCPRRVIVLGNNCPGGGGGNFPGGSYPGVIIQGSNCPGG